MPKRRPTAIWAAAWQARLSLTRRHRVDRVKPGKQPDLWPHDAPPVALDERDQRSTMFMALAEQLEEKFDRPPVIGRAHVGYLPAKRVVAYPTWRGWCTGSPVGCRFRRNSAEAIQDILEPQGVGVVIEAEHSCMTFRG
jgi:GTP cyclohydrolase I